MSSLNPVGLFLSILIKEARKNVVSTNGYALTPAQQINEFRTVMLGLPRRSGKTTALLELAKKEHSLIFVPTKVQAREMVWQHQLPANCVYSFGSDLNPPISAGIFMKHSGVELLLVDEGLRMDARTRQCITEIASRLWVEGKVNIDKFLVVFIGT